MQVDSETGVQWSASSVGTEVETEKVSTKLWHLANKVGSLTKYVEAVDIDTVVVQYWL